MTSDLRCPACAARVRADAPWCTQCYAALETVRTAAAPRPVSGQAAPTPEPASPALPAPRAGGAAALPALHGLAAPVWPCLSCGTANPLERPACGACGAPFLAADRRPVLVVPGLGDLAALSRAQRVGAALVVVLAVLVLTALLATG